MGQKVSSSPRTRNPVFGSPYQTSPPDTAGTSSSSSSGQFLSVSNGHGAYFTNTPGQSSAPGTSTSATSSSARNRTRSMVCTPTHSHSQGHCSQSHSHHDTDNGQVQGQGASSDSNSDDEVLDRIIGAVRTGGSTSRHANGHTRASRGRSLPLSAPLSSHLFPQSFFSAGIKCPVCSKFVPPDDIEVHLVVCLTKPRIVYNEDVLVLDSGECVICLDELEQGDTIARLPCLCIYHKTCIDMWFERNRSCPEHPLD